MAWRYAWTPDPALAGRRQVIPRDSGYLTIPRRVAVALPSVAPPPLALAALVLLGVSGGSAGSELNAAAHSAVHKDIFIAFSLWCGRDITPAGRRGSAPRTHARVRVPAASTPMVEAADGCGRNRRPQCPNRVNAKCSEGANNFRFLPAGDLPPLKWSSLKYGFDHGG